MENNIHAALSYLCGDYLINASIIDPIQQGTVDVLCADRNVAFVKDKLSGVYMLSSSDLDLAAELIEEMPSTAPLVAHSLELCELAQKIKGYNSVVPCYQAVYLDEMPKMSGLLKCRPLCLDEAEEAVKMYHFDLDSARRHIELGLVYGGFDGDLVGMVGFHYQGSMGMLEVKPKYRHMGYGEQLEKFIIAQKLLKGGVPYCQVVQDNAASLALQKKLGLKISDNLLYWLHKDKE